MKISIIGAAGTIGSCAAFNIAIHGITDELVMIDDFSQDKLEGYVTDLGTAVTGLDTSVRAGKMDDLRDSDIVLMAAGSSQVMVNRMEVLPQNLPIIANVAAQVRRLCPRAVVITATNPVDPLNYAMYLSAGLDKKQVIGYSANDSVRFRMFLSEALGVKSSQVEATAVGEHGPTQVLLFSSVRVKGKAVAVSPEMKQSIRQRLADLPKLIEPQRIKTGRTQGWATSMGLTALCRALSKNTGEVMPCSVLLDGEYGYRGMSLSVPVVLGKEGVRRIQEWKLTAEEKEDLGKSAETLRPAMKVAEEFLQKGRG
jgi:malate dehydrogenase